MSKRIVFLPTRIRQFYWRTNLPQTPQSVSKQLVFHLKSIAVLFEILNEITSFLNYPPFLVTSGSGKFPLNFSKALFDNPIHLAIVTLHISNKKKTLKLNKIKNKFSITLNIHILRLILLTFLVLLCPGRTIFYSSYFSPILFHYSATVSMRSLYLPRKGKHFIKKLFKHFQRNILDYLSIAAAES